MREPNLPIFVLFLTVIFFSISSAIDTLTPSQPLSYGETLISANGTFALGFFTPPDTTNRYLGIWYHSLPVQTVVWVANRRNPIPNLNATLSITPADASLHLTTSGNSTALWSSPSFPNSIPKPIAQLLDTGNFVVKSSDSSSILWQSFDHPSDTMLSGMKIGCNLKTGIDHNLTAWLSLSDPSPGKYAFAIDPIGVPQLVIRDASGGWLWRGGPWNGYGFSGARPNPFFYVNLYPEKLIQNFTSTPEEVNFSFNTLGDAIAIITMDQNGTVRLYEWQASTQKWNTDWLAPSDDCDFFPACGANAICDASNSPLCRCLDGFEPRDPVSWGRGKWVDGCVRVAALGCGAKGTDEFTLLRGLKLPDTSEATADMNLGLDGCRARCSANCSCVAYASVYISDGGKGCIIWLSEIRDIRLDGNTGHDFYVRVASPRKGSKRKTWIVVTTVTILLILPIIVICIFMIRRWRHKEFSLDSGDEIMQKLEADKEGSSKISLFQFTQLVSATNNFSIANKLGEGGFGPVYKGKLPDGQDIAIKRLSTISGQGIDELKNEILLISKLQHTNLVRLLGFCIHGEEKMLIYEFMLNKSLDLWLFDVKQGSKLDWTRRFEIIEGIAQGLLYLHKHSRLRIIHRDLKASNILLDVDMKPKISDFGMARIFDSNETQANTRRVVGTYGYMPPEYAFNGLFSAKSDVFSFGVLLLEIVSGKRNVGFHEFKSYHNILSHAWDLWKAGTWIELVDPILENQFRHNEMARCIYVALQCVQERPDDRPVMSDIVIMLSNENLYFGHPKQPAFFSRKNASNSKWPLNLHVNSSSNGLSLSSIAGR